MDKTKLCKIHFVASTIFYPTVLIAIFQSLLWAVMLLFFSLAVAVIKHNFDALNNNSSGKYHFLLKIVQFLIFNCVFGLFHLVKYLYDKDDEETYFLFDVSWTLFFSIVSLFFMKSNYWYLYILIIIFLSITQSIIHITHQR